MEYIGTQKLVQRILIDKWYKNFFGHICIAKDLLELIKKKKKDLLEEHEKDLSNEYQLMLKLWILYKQLLFSMFS